jgi:hypothetical protein
LLDPLQGGSTVPNRVSRAASVTNVSFDTLDIGRTYTNVSGQAMTRLRFRIVNITSSSAPSRSCC